jgi:hypothetical protein
VRDLAACASGDPDIFPFLMANSVCLGYRLAQPNPCLLCFPQLANEVIRRNIGSELQKLKKAPSWQRESGRSSETLVKYGEFRIVLVRMNLHP